MRYIIAAFSCLSDISLFCAQINILSLISSETRNKSRYILSVFAVGITGFLLKLTYADVSAVFQFVLMLLNCFRVSFFTLFALKIFTLTDTLILLIIQYLCSALSSAVCAVIPQQILADYPYIRQTILLFFTTLFLIVSVITSKRLRKRRVALKGLSSVIPSKIYLLILLIIFIQNGLVETLDYNTLQYDLKTKVIKVLLIPMIICITAVIISLTVNVAYQRHYKMATTLLENQVNSQLHHYKQMEKIDNEIRKFRHDYNNHIRCLNAILAAHRYEEAQSYLDKISAIAPSGEFSFRTGNYIADAILTEKQEQCTNKDITVHFDGIIPQSIESTDLCIILSNAIDNAIEACEKLQGEKNISVYSNFQQGFFVMIIKNPCTDAGFSKDIIPDTSKEDKQSHGFGLLNIQQAIFKYNGTMHTLIENGTFTLSLAFESIKNEISV